MDTIQFEARLMGLKKTRNKDGDWFLDRAIPEPNSGCWLWLRSVNSDGYGTVGRNKRTIGAHRLAYEALIGTIPRNMHVLHKCDVPCCVNPDHLFLGTHADNMADMKNKNRANKPIGTNNGRAILSEEEVLEIRSSPLGCWRLSKQYGMHVSTIKDIRSGKRWRHIV